MIGVFAAGGCSRINRADPKPSSTGMRTSIRISAKVCFRIASTAPRPESTSTIAWSSGSSIARSARRLAASSSTIRIAGAGLGPVDWVGDSEGIRRQGPAIAVGAAPGSHSPRTASSSTVSTGLAT